MSTTSTENTEQPATKTKIIDEEYYSASSGEDTCKKDDIKLKEICTAINERETKYVFGAEENESNEDTADIRHPYTNQENKRTWEEDR